MTANRLFMDNYTQKYLEDVLTACKEVSSFFENQPKLFENFKDDTLRQRAVERNVEIMWEAINQMLKRNPDVALTNAKVIVSTRNRVIHGYDSVTPEFLWSLIIKHIPLLQQEVETLLQNNCTTK